ncbi:Hpt domain-containing protein [Hydrogenimonas sp.]
MLIYRNDGTLYSVSKKALKLAGYSDMAQFLDDHDDYSELFVKKPGYIYNFENFSWLSFLRNANPEQKRVLIATRDNATYEAELELETFYPVEFGEHTPEFFYQVEFKNLHLASESAGSGGFEPFAATTAPAFETPESPAKVFEESPTAETRETSVTFEIPAAPSPFEIEEPAKAPVEEAPLFFDTGLSHTSEKEEFETEAGESEPTVFGGEPAAGGLESPETPLFMQAEPKTQEKTEGDDEALELVDFTLEEPAAETKEEPETPLAVDDEALANAFAELETPAVQAESPAEEKPREEPPTVFELPVSPAPEAAGPESPESPGGSPAFEMPDLRKAAAALGLPETMVKAFIAEFVETYAKDADELKLAIASGHEAVVKKEAMKLKGIAANLMMEPLVGLLESAMAARGRDTLRSAWEKVEAYVVELGRVYAPEVAVAHPAERPAPESASTPKEEAEAVRESEEERPAESAAEPEKAGEGVELSLEENPEAAPVAFDPAEAAGALGLPESLIVEFVNDFIAQARDERQTFLEAFEAGDLKRVNETAHKLKGVAANLRIEEMRELMERAQHARSLEEARGPLEAFYGKLGALDQTMAKEYA